MKHQLWFSHSYDSDLPICHFCHKPVNLQQWETEDCPDLRCTPVAHVWPDALTDQCLCGAVSISDVVAC